MANNTTASSSCPDIPDAIVDPFEAPEFENTPAIRWMHETTPRFGHSRNLEYLMTGNEDQQRDYIKGLIASSILFLCLFVVWVTFLIVCKCLGKYETGLFSGQPKPHPPKPDNTDKTQSNRMERRAWMKSYKRAQTRIKLLRVVVFFSGSLVIVSALLMSINGVRSLSQSLESGRESITMIQMLTLGGIDLMDSVISQNKETAVAIQAIVQEANGMCPKIRPELCTNVTDLSTCNFDDLFGASQRDIVQALLDHFAQADRSIYYKDMVKVKNDLNELLQVSQNVDDKAQQVSVILICAMVFNGFLAGICFVFILGLLLPQSLGLLHCVRHWLLMPTFSVLVALSFVFAIIFIIGSMAVADMCINSPDDRILILLHRFQSKLGSPIVVDFVSFYIHRCPASMIPTEIADQLQFVLDAAPAIGDFSKMVQSSATSIQAVCGFNDTAPLVQIADKANVQLCEIADILKDIRDFFQCHNWFPLYETTVYETICYNGTQGFAWIASTQFFIVFFSLIVLTFRSVFYDIEIRKHNDNNNTTGDGNSTTDATAPVEESPNFRKHRKYKWYNNNNKKNTITKHPSRISHNQHHEQLRMERSTTYPPGLPHYIMENQNDTGFEIEI